MALSPQQQRVARTILRVGRRVGATAKERKAAIETGIVESNLSNPRGGDGTSVGWRQETASSYPGVNRRDVAAAAERFFSETRKVRGKYARAGDLAQAVQRSAFPARYQQASGKAQQILRGSPSGGGSGGGSTTVPGVDNSQARKQLVAQYLLSQNQGSDTQSVLDNGTSLLQTIAAVRQLPDTPSRTVSTGGGSGGGKNPKGPKGLYELFWQGPGGIDVKKGQREPQGFVSGHKDHVHVAASRGDIVRLGKLAQQMGLHVGENPHFGGVHPVHVSGSYHYKGQAIDVSGNPRSERKFARKVARIYGA